MYLIATSQHVPKLMGLDILYCGKWRKISKSCHDLDLDRTMPNVELVRAIFIYYNMFTFQIN